MFSELPEMCTCSCVCNRQTEELHPVCLHWNVCTASQSSHHCRSMAQYPKIPRGLFRELQEPRVSQADLHSMSPGAMHLLPGVKNSWSYWWGPDCFCSFSESLSPLKSPKQHKAFWSPLLLTVFGILSLS